MYATPEDLKTHLYQARQISEGDEDIVLSTKFHYLCHCYNVLTLQIYNKMQ